MDTFPLLSPSEQRARALALAAESGFSLCGIALISESTPRSEAYQRWLEQRYHGPLEYMLRSQQARSKTSERFSWARSVLALGAFYDGASRGEPGKDLVAHIAGYARGRDYHKIFEKRLKLLSAALIKERVCGRARAYVDTGPILERAWAEAAGLGWIGKNACLIHPRLGSFFLLAEVLMDSTPEPDAPAQQHCGTCRRCLDVCPTQALVEPGVLDAQRCLVTWNIERRGETPESMWKDQGAWAAGCDLCQTVCPFNAPQRTAAPDAELAEPLPWQSMTLADCITMTPEIFDRAFKASALRRTTLKGLRLGAITAAGNVCAEPCRQALAQCVNDSDADIRQRANWALQQFR
ncbi:MAG TPA: tRNA epoxyqueuosine(34) reductase QueG [Planctomycetota bacterium]|nr:tRNA epoxyqueuosine(34) reductase QueG [Planctomycetota bacterium]